MAIDNSPQDEGAGAASGPMELVLMGLGGCSAVDVLLILKKMRVKVTDCQINLEAERAEEHPRVFTKVSLEYLFKGEDLKPKDLERAIQLSIDKYCSVAGMLSKTARIQTSYRFFEKTSGD